jgi:hypothetical protein
MEAILVSPFNMAWGCYAWSGGVEVSEFCLFLMVFPARCISSISLRVYFRKHTFCFLPLVAILESLRGNFITMNAYIKSIERSQINGLMLHLKISAKTLTS